ncbi:MAG: hypothetical protein K1X82_02190 [Bacteroidia bacterium]|nr:hypothetical protein [Bacteroidia bacterium]
MTEKRRRRTRWEKFKDFWVDLWESQFPEKKFEGQPKRRRKSKGISGFLNEMLEDVKSKDDFKANLTKKRKTKISFRERLKRYWEDSFGKTDLNQPKKRFNLSKWFQKQVEFYSEENQLDKKFKVEKTPFKERVKEFIEGVKTLRFRRDLWKFDLLPMVNSTMMMVTSYLLLFFAQEILTGLIATHYNLKPTVFLYAIKYANYYEPGIWNLWSVTRTYSAGPIFCLFVGIFAFLFFQILQGIRKDFRLFLLWVACNSLIIFYSKVIFIPITSISGLGTWQGLGIVAAWFYIGTANKFIMAFLAAALLFLTGFIFTEPILKMAGSRLQVSNNDEKARSINQLALGPMLIGTFIVFLVNREFNIFQNVFTLSSGLFMLLIAYFNSLGTKGVIAVHKSTGKLEKFNYLYLILMLLAISGFIYVTIVGIKITFRLL